MNNKRLLTIHDHISNEMKDINGLTTSLNEKIDLFNEVIRLKGKLKEIEDFIEDNRRIVNVLDLRNSGITYKYSVKLNTKKYDDLEKIFNE